MKKIIIGNWKMNPLDIKTAKALVVSTTKALKSNKYDVAICPPFPFLGTFAGQKKPALGAQDVYIEKTGAYTGEVSAPMLRSFGVSFVIVGHSERRAMGEKSDMVAKKAVSALKSKITPVICVGEQKRDASAEHWQEIKWQLVDSLQGIAKNDAKNIIVAYEPVWAIGKDAVGVLDPDSIEESIIYIKKVLAEMYGIAIAEKIRVIYGGSVDTKNAKHILAKINVGGLLVGRASINSRDFTTILHS